MVAADDRADTPLSEDSRRRGSDLNRALVTRASLSRTTAADAGTVNVALKVSGELSPQMALRRRLSSCSR